MNFLAHLRLAGETPESRLGNFLGDFVRGRPDHRFEPAIWAGIMHHRHLDAFTDRHPAWKAGRERLAPERRRFAGIVVDVFFDHFLSRWWDRFGWEDRDLDRFIAECHRDLAATSPQAPEEARQAITWMRRQGWLESYREIDGIDEAMRRISRRSKRLGPIRDAVNDLKRDYEGFERDFLGFFPDVLIRSGELHAGLGGADSL